MASEFDMNSIKMLTSLIIILGAIVLLFFLLRRLRLSPLMNGRSPVMRILGTLNLAPKRAVALVEICDQWLVVGIGTENVTLISKIDRPPDADTAGLGIPSNEGRFSSLLENFGLRRRDRIHTGEQKNAET